MRLLQPAKQVEIRDIHRDEAAHQRQHEAAVLLDEDKMGLLDEPVHEADQLAHDGD